MAQGFRLDRSNPLIRYAIVTVMAVVLWIQVVEISDQQALVICMFSVACLGVMLNRLSYANDRGPRRLLPITIVYGISVSILFANEIKPFLSKGPLQSVIVFSAIICGIYGSYLSQKRVGQEAA